MRCNAFPLRAEASRAHTVPGLQNSLLSMSQLVADGYIPIFDGEKIGIYDYFNTKITVSQAAVMEGWYVPSERLWMIPLAKGVRSKRTNVNLETVATKESPMELLAATAPPVNHILSVYELKTRPEPVKYYHAAAGFPTQPTWIVAIKNGHYSTWKGLSAAVASRHFPESNETW